MGKVLSAQGSGYFPGCLETDSSAIFTLEEAMKIYWRVRSWTISGTYVNNLNESSPFSQTFTSTLADESHLVCLTRAYYPYFETDFLPYTDSNFFFRPYNFYLFGSLYIPQINFSILPSGTTPLPIGTEVNDPSSTIGTLTIFGKTIPFLAEKGDGDEFPRSANGTMVPASYWSFGGTYNTSTGEPLT